MGDDKTIDLARNKRGVGDSRPYPRERAGNLIERRVIPAGTVVRATGRETARFRAPRAIVEWT